ncbi:unnamed protein product [Effrenium voratum]|nr:unnamed protein product [Effrenium voratum]
MQAAPVAPMPMAAFEAYWQLRSTELLFEWLPTPVLLGTLPAGVPAPAPASSLQPRPTATSGAGTDWRACSLSSNVQLLCFQTWRGPEPGAKRLPGADQLAGAGPAPHSPGFAHPNLAGLAGLAGLAVRAIGAGVAERVLAQQLS